MAAKLFLLKCGFLFLFLSIILINTSNAQTHEDHDGHTHVTDPTDVHTDDAHIDIINTTHIHTEEDSHTHVHAAEEEAESGHSHSASCEIEANSSYNMPMRIGSIFIILATSAVGIFAPIILHRVSPYQPGSPREWILTAGKFFGTGVIIATAFIHMLPEALERFDSPCLSAGWHSYHAFGGVFCLIASFALQLLELAALTNLDNLARKNAASKAGDEKLEDQKIHAHDHTGIHEDGHVHTAGFLENEQSVRNLGTFILELGIVMHSIIIGVTLGTTDNDEFTTLLIALVFHQFFEGIALGTRINDLNCQTWRKPIIMGILFVCMTPIGVAIGIGIRSTIDPRASILAQAILDSLSAGILLYSAYVSLMSIEINHNTGFRQSSIFRKAFCFICMYLGAALMAVLGTWA
ncbi:hypothetical protein RMATCC62417_09436 [Rhizopus microsporus]|nr:hypothetical protein RMATCC62417_09436 [Rhizopus microsporus]